jgi:4-amino-4-deoxy-L-arabinose transferase-like glycosyltransferase
MYGEPLQVVFFVGLIGLIAAGLFLCRYTTKYIILSIVCLFLLTIYLYYSFSVNFVDWDKTAVLIPLIIIIFFFSSLYMLIRCGIYLRAKKLMAANNGQTVNFLVKDFSFKDGIHRFLKWSTRKENMIICARALIVFTVHLFYINTPPYKIGDEPSYVGEANRILSGQPMWFLEHPPLGKLFIAGGIFLFGDNAVGWRIFPVLFGVASIFIFYLLCTQLIKNSRENLNNPEVANTKWSKPAVFIPVMSTFLFAFENLSFVMAHMAMLDVFYVTFMLLGFLFYLKQRFVLCGIAMGLSLLCKETAVFGVIAIFLHWVITRRKEIIEDIKYTWHTLNSRKIPEYKKSVILNISQVPLIIGAMWMLLLPPMEWAKTPLWGNIFTRTWYIVWKNLTYSGTGQGNGLLVPTHTWELFFRQQLQNFNTKSSIPHYFNAISFSIWILLIPVTVYLAIQAYNDLKHHRNNSIAVFAFCWFVLIYGLFIIIDVLINRPMYLFYFYPAVPAVCLTIALGSWKLWGIARRRRVTKVAFLTILSLYLVGTLVCFFIMSPLGSNLIK